MTTNHRQSGSSRGVRALVMDVLGPELPAVVRAHILEATRPGAPVDLVVCLGRPRSIGLWAGDELLAQVDFDAGTHQ